jgi:hypothetical protein
VAHFRHTEPHIADIEKQIRWEMHGVERGAERVREAMAEAKHLGDTDVGMKLIAKVAPKLIGKIREAQTEATLGVNSGKRGAPQQWWWLILTIDAEQLAVIVLKSLFTQSPREFTFNLSVTSVANAISKHSHTQIDYEEWKATEKEKAREAAKAGDEDHVDQHMRFLRSTKQLDHRAWAKFTARIQRVRKEKWPIDAGVQFGAKMVDLLCEAVPDWFSVQDNRLKGGQHEKAIVFSDEAKLTMADLMERNEVSRPMLLPMICPPAPWRRAS